MLQAFLLQYAKIPTNQFEKNPLDGNKIQLKRASNVNTRNHDVR